MARIANIARYRRGAPPARARIMLELAPETMAALDHWIERQPIALISRPEAIRQLLQSARAVAR